MRRLKKGQNLRIEEAAIRILAERRKMMQAWADYLDSLREGGKR